MFGLRLLAEFFFFLIQQFVFVSIICSPLNITLYPLFFSWNVESPNTVANTGAFHGIYLVSVASTWLSVAHTGAIHL